MANAPDYVLNGDIIGLGYFTSSDPVNCGTLKYSLTSDTGTSGYTGKEIMLEAAPSYKLMYKNKTPINSTFYIRAEFDTQAIPGGPYGGPWTINTYQKVDYEVKCTDDLPS